MPKLITDQIKSLASFAWAKNKQSNSREAARYTSFFENDADWNKCAENVKEVFFLLAQEPNVEGTQFAYSIAKDGIQYPTRSKLVMEYQRQDRMLKAIRKLRTQNKELCDNILAGISIAEAGSYKDKRAFVLEKLTQRINP